MKPTPEQYELLTFYHFVDIPESEVESVCADHLQFCHDIGLHGRIYIGTEGISSTVSGNLGQCRAYRMYLENSSYFKNIADIDTKSTRVEAHQFPKLTVKVRNEIVVLGAKVTAEEVHKYRKELTPEEFKKIIDNEDPNYLILDMRNDYEYRLGHFKGAIPAGTVNFREVPELLARYKDKAQGKKIIWYCTGGIRCEKAAVLANKAGIEDVYAVEGGVVKYVNTINDGNWLGNLYTFDDRVSTYVGDSQTHTTIGTCVHTGKLTDHCDNCRYTECNARIIVDLDEHQKHLGFCSQECFEKAIETLLVKDVEWDMISGTFDGKSTQVITPVTPAYAGVYQRKTEMDPRISATLRPRMTEHGTYKSLRSQIKAGKILFPEAQKLVESHLRKKIGNIQFTHRESQKEGVIVMD